MEMEPCPYCKADCMLGKIVFQGNDGGFVTNHQVQCSRSMTECGYRARGHWAEMEAVRLHNDFCTDEPTQSMVIAGFESEAFDALVNAVPGGAWPYTCKQSAECVTGIYRAMRARMRKT